MQSYNARYSSFAPPQRSKSSFKASSSLKWPHPTSFLATPTSLATAGFYFNPSSATPDAVSCFLCEKGLADWDPEDDPAEIHAQKCPKCPWAILKCITDLSDNGSVNFSSPSRLPSSRTMEKARLATFGSEGKKWWPHDAKNKGPTSKVMAKAGFIFTPAGSKDDTCSCIYCGIELGGWQSDDDPLEEHRSRQAKKGPCLFFTDSDNPPTVSKRARSKSKPPPVTPAAASSSDQEYQPPGTKSSTRATSSKQPGSSAKSKPSSKSSKKATKTKTIEEEVVAEYHVALDEDEDAPPRPRPKSRRASSRSRSRSQTSSTRTTSATISADEAHTAPSSTGKTTVTSSTKSSPIQEPEGSDITRPPSPTSHKAPKPTKKSTKRTESQRSARSKTNKNPPDDTEARMDDEAVPAPITMPAPGPLTSPLTPPSPPRQVPNGIHSTAIAAALTSILPPQFISFQSPEDEEFALEEQALEEQARELMLADTALHKLASAPLANGKTRIVERDDAILGDSAGEPHRHLVIDKGKGKAKMSPAERAAVIEEAAPVPPPSTPPPCIAPIAKSTFPSVVKFPQLVPDDTITSLSEAERAMTVEQWIRHEMDHQYERLKSDGRQKIDAFKARALEVAKQIETL